MSIPAPDRDEVTETLEEGPSRYAAYAMRLRTLITSTSRYVAYTSDIGEAFRPLTSPAFVRACYGISWAYLVGDVGYAGYKAHQQHEHDTAGIATKVEDKAKEAVNVGTDKLKQIVGDSGQRVELRRSHDGSLEKHAAGHSDFSHVGLVMARRAVFQSIASMALPAFTIHSVVRYSAPIFARSASKRVRGAGPTIAGLAFVPALVSLVELERNTLATQHRC
ncbi:hypothetical protein IE81DRAFT_320663 [Ceraceosorus guamensis]|uniref:Mitochondrial fission process protein 1 n=1 Tax=Ceraceosorus guamensis TaxID=1522189 RepID=A0A316W5X9_9BASI|nr:hypothetical protein IE81DRAFT_320663 [Ceraceosorus guamensis]PWN45064.1 hypothetical protein IE81DRAFT_320663 [Ceraceosorus guamensis]